ncbi:MAG: hypothetical protein PHW03_01215 [Eubacteriales bacterium]|nr:hypothetical protein [Eubacteriales bacterium]MDD4389403.1 hypothetical protein [Eubacteriales bacterium]
MKALKKAGIIGGAVIGGVVGGAFSVIGAVSKVKVLDEIGASVIDSSITTGAIAGNLVSGTADVLAGKIIKKPKLVKRGKNDLRKSGGDIVDNFFENLAITLENGNEIIDGVKAKDRRRALAGTKTFFKMAAVGALTSGAMKISEEGVRSSKSQETHEEHDCNQETGLVSPETNDNKPNE